MSHGWVSIGFFVNLHGSCGPEVRIDRLGAHSFVVACLFTLRWVDLLMSFKWEQAESEKRREERYAADVRDTILFGLNLIDMQILCIKIIIRHINQISSPCAKQKSRKFS